MMSAPWLMLALTYFSLVVFVAGVALRAIKYARAPMHLRWELYPIPHERGKGYGGSYFEEVDWWARPRDVDVAGEVRAMLEEMLLIRSLWHRNRSQWYASFPFHFGLYLLAGFSAILVLAALVGATWDSLLQPVALAVGAAGLGLATLGALGLLWRRLADPVLRVSSTRGDYLNLLVLLAVFLSGDFAWLTVGNAFPQMREFAHGVLTLAPARGTAPAITLHVALACLFLIYLPFTHMTHFVAKYFTYHQVRWDDTPNRGDPAMMARMQANLARPVGWSGPHIQPDSNWAEVASEVK